MMLGKLLAGLGLALIVVACGSEEGDAGTAAPEANATKVPADVLALVKKVDDNCAANGTGDNLAFKFDVKKFDAAKLMSDFKTEDKDKMGVDCSKERQYSTSREDGVKLFREHLNDEAEDTKKCIASTLTPAERTTLDKLVSDPENLGVFSNIFVGDNSEGCNYYEFHVFRKDGVAIDLVFNFTD